MKTRKCNKCKEVKDISNFTKSTKDGHMFSCKPCANILRKEWRKNNPEKNKAMGRRNDKLRTVKRQNDSEARRKYQSTQRRIKYGITNEDFDNKMIEQNNLCAICKKQSEKTLCIDHDHDSGKVRGLLCHQCNLILGNSKDNINTLLEAITYLQKYKI